MNERQVQRLVQLSRKTGDSLIVLDEQGGGSVILPLDRYEQLVQASPSSPVVKKEDKRVAPAQVQAQETASRSVVQEQIPSPPPPEDTEVETQFYLEPVE